MSKFGGEMTPELSLKDILLVHNLEENLLSIDQMMENGYSLHFDKDIFKIYDSRGIGIGQVKMEKINKSFPIRFKHGSNIANKVKGDGSCLWHKRFGHFNTHALN